MTLIICDARIQIEASKDTLLQALLKQLEGDISVQWWIQKLRRERIRDLKRERYSTNLI